MKSKTDLYELIRAMSKTEKRYFTLDAQKSGRHSRYLELFQAINAMESYDEAALRQQFGKNLPTDKNYLYEAILRSMRDYRSAGSYAARIKEMILDARYLYERGLYEQSEVRLRESKSLARELGDHLSILEINKEEGRIIFDLQKRNYGHLIAEVVTEHQDEMRLLAEELQYLEQCYQLAGKIISRFELKEAEEKARFQQAYNFDTAGVPRSAQGQRRYYQALAMYYQLIGDFDQVFFYYGKVLEWWDDHPKYKSDEFHRFVVDLSNFLHAAITKGQYRYVPDLIARLDREKPTHFHDQAVLFQKTTIYKLIYYINLDNPKQIAQISESIEADLLRYNVNPVSTIAIVSNLVIGLFVSGQYEQCVAWCQKIIKDEFKANPRTGIRKGMHLLNLFAMLEIGDVERFDNQWRATHRFFNQDDQLLPFESKILDFVKKIANVPTRQLKPILHQFKSYLMDLRQAGAVRSPFGLDEILLVWTDSKIENLYFPDFFIRQRDK